VRSFQISAVFPHLSVLENVRIGLQRKLGTRSLLASERSLRQLNDRAMELLDRWAWTEFADERHGRAALRPQARARDRHHAGHGAELMLLDEPTQGMGHEDVDRVTQLIKKVSANRTILMVEHNMNVVSTIADRITVLQRGSSAGRRALRRSVEEPAGAGSLHGQHRRPNCREPMPNGHQASEPLLASADLHAWYGESHILHGVDLMVGPAKSSPCSGATAPAAPPPEVHHGPGRRRKGSIMINGRRPSAWPRTASRAWAWATARKSAASSPA
jgi:branched-chain amino acid transport system ATP-binding protein